MKRTISMVLAFMMITVSCCGCMGRQSFSAYLDEVVKEAFTDDYLGCHYTFKDPSAYGVTKPEPNLGGFPEKIRNADTALWYLSGYENEEMTGEEEICYQILQFYGGISKEYPDAYLYYEPLDALRGVPANLPVSLAEFRFDSEESVEDYFEILKDIERYFDDLLKFEKKRAKKGYFVSREELEQVIDQCRDFAEAKENVLVTTMDSRLKKLNLSEEKTAELKKTNQTLVTQRVIPAYEKLADTLEKDFMDQCVEAAKICEYPDGKEYYRYLLISRTGTNLTPEELMRRVEAELQEYLLGQRDILEQRPEVLEEYRAFVFPDSPPEETLSFFMEQMKGTYPAPASKEFRLETVDPSLEDSTSPAFYVIPPLDDPDANAIYLNLGERYQNSSLFTTLAHEGYPGHLYQMTKFQSMSPHPVRWIYASLGYEEGWATAAEQWAWTQTGAQEDTVRFCQLQDLISLAVYTLTDLYVNYEGADGNEVYRKLRHAGVDKDLAENLTEFCETYELHTMPYYVGYLEMEDILTEAKKISGGNITNEELYEEYLKIGPAPFSTVRELMLEWADSKGITEAAKALAG